MRDHRAASRAILARYARTPRRLRAADRVVAALVGPRHRAATLHTHTHRHLAITLALSHHVHRPPSAGCAASPRASQRPPGVVTIVATLQAPPRHRRRAVSAPVASAVSPWAAMHSRDLTLITTRTEARIRVVDRVLSRPVASAEPANAASRPAPPVDPFHTAHVRPAGPPVAPSPAELNVITDHVLTAIDRRLIAHNERFGRG